MNAGRMFVVASLLTGLAVVMPGGAMAKRGGTDRPLKGSGSGTTTADLATGIARAEGVARLSHFGKGSYRLDVTFAPSGLNTFSLAGTGTLVAANGDRAFSTLTGTVSATGIGVGETAEQTVIFTISGGTGRFADATGRLTAAVSTETVSLVTTTLFDRDIFTAHGTISY
jgi:hypothetical protein